MKIHLHRSASGNGLVIALIFTAVLGMSLISYLDLVRHQNRMNFRSLAWNHGMALAESGVEEAMAHLNFNGTNGLATQGWTATNSKFTVTRQLSNGYYVVTIQPTANNMPLIESDGYSELPLVLSSAQGPMFAAAGVGLASTPKYVKRSIRVTTTNAALFAKSLVAKNQIDLRGNNMYSDSFDSTTNTASTGGLYDPAKRRANGDVATNSGLTNSLNVGNADIYGKVATGPGGSVSIGNNGYVGDIAWNSNPANRGRIQPGHYVDDMNVAFPKITPPFTSGATPTPVGSDYIIGSGNWYFGSLHVSGTQKITITGDAVIYFADDFTMTGQSELIIAPGATLKIYCAGDYTLTGLGVFNQAGQAINAQFYGTETCGSVALGGNGNLTGVIYAPNADFTTVGNGDIYGAVVCETAQLTGNGNFHYDESLGRLGPRRAYVPVDWKEL